MFVGNFKRGAGTWTAVSRPPWFTALAMWPKGDTWGGGGLFESNRRLALNQQPVLAEDFSIPRGFEVVPFQTSTDASTLGDSVASARAVRDGWKEIDGGKLQRLDLESKVQWRFDPPVIWARLNPKHPRLSLRSILHGVHEKNGRWYRLDHQLLSDAEPAGPELTRTEWADWDSTGDLLFARAGRLYRMRVGKGGAPLEPTELADFRNLRFEAKAAPADATAWPRQ